MDRLLEDIHHPLAPGEFLSWPVPEDLRNSPAVTYRDEFARRLSARPVPEIVKSYVYLSIEQMQRMVDLATEYVLGKPLQGKGIELGAGCGLLSSIVARAKGVDAVFALELCEELPRRIMPSVARAVLGEDSGKVIPVAGSFDDLQLPDDFLDFAVEIDSLHHSDELATTLKERARVLKTGGRLLCFDRCHPNSFTDSQVEQSLSIVYSRDFLVANCYPPDITMTRRENGEHEYRLFEWEAAFRSAGFRIVKRVPFYKKISLKRAIKGLLTLAPRPIRRRFFRSEEETFATFLLWVLQQLPLRNGRFGACLLAPKNTTVFLATKEERGTQGAG